MHTDNALTRTDLGREFSKVCFNNLPVQLHKIVQVKKQVNKLEILKSMNGRKNNRQS